MHYLLQVRIYQVKKEDLLKRDLKSANAFSAGKKRKRSGPKRPAPQIGCQWKGCKKLCSDTESFLTRHLYQDHLHISYRCLKGCPANKRYSRVDIADRHDDHKYSTVRYSPCV